MNITSELFARRESDGNDSTERCGASSTCIDTDGSYECGCEEGYEFTGPEKDNETGNIKLGRKRRKQKMGKELQSWKLRRGKMLTVLHLLRM